MLTRAIINTVQTHHLRANTASTIIQAKIPRCDLNTDVYEPVNVKETIYYFWWYDIALTITYPTYCKLMINNDEFSIHNHSKEIENMCYSKLLHFY